MQVEGKCADRLQFKKSHFLPVILRDVIYDKLGNENETLIHLKMVGHQFHYPGSVN